MKKKQLMTASELIRRAREAAGLSRKKVADPMGRTSEWLRLFEKEKRPLPPEIRVAILEVIRRLSAYRTVERKQRDAFVSNLMLPRYVRSKGRKKTG
jgi:ribosome-binding protein aMBF1 (putative translation factor)